MTSIERLTVTPAGKGFAKILVPMRETLTKQSPALLPQLSGDGFTDVVTLEQVQTLLESYDLPPNLVDLAQDTRPLPKSSYVRLGELDRQAVCELHHGGATIILRAAHRWLGGLRDLCACAESMFAAPAQANVYLTPPARQSTPPHWDTHDLFILQIAGSKNWRLFDALYSFPLDDQRYDKEVFGLGNLHDELLLTQGDVLYLPRGAIHEPRALTYSAHIALGIQVVRASDMLAGLVNAAARTMPELREIVDLPARVCDGDAIEVVAKRLVAVMELATDLDAARAAVLAYLSDFLGQRLQPSTRLLSNPDLPLDGGRCYQLNAHSYLVAQRQGEHVRLSWGHGQLIVPIEHAGLIEKICRGEPFAPSSEPGEMEIESAVVDSLLQECVLTSTTADVRQPGELSEYALRKNNNA